MLIQREVLSAFPQAKHTFLDPSLNSCASLVGPCEPFGPLFSQLSFSGAFLALISGLSESLQLMHVLSLVLLGESPCRPECPPKKHAAITITCDSRLWPPRCLGHHCV